MKTFCSKVMSVPITVALVMTTGCCCPTRRDDDSIGMDFTIATTATYKRQHGIKVPGNREFLRSDQSTGGGFSLRLGDRGASKIRHLTGSFTNFVEEEPSGTQYSYAYRGGIETLKKFFDENVACGTGVGYIGHFNERKNSGVRGESHGIYFDFPCELLDHSEWNKTSILIRLTPFLGYETIGSNGKATDLEFRAHGGSMFGGLNLELGFNKIFYD